MSEAGSDIVVMKFGGTSVAGAEQIKRAAGRIVAAREAAVHDADIAPIFTPPATSGREWHVGCS